jgi:hypothetical protein
MFQMNRALGKVALLILAGASLSAQEVVGTLTGTVKDDQNKPVANAVIHITAPQLMQPRRVVTDPQGGFRAPLLPPGDYKIIVNKDGFIGQSATNVRLGVGTTTRQDFTLKHLSAKAEATVEVIASTAGMDKTDTKTSTSFSSDQLLAIPTSGGDRGIFGALDLAPGAARSPGGGSSIRGGKTQETGFTVNGTSIKDEYEGRVTSTTYIDDAVEDTQVIQSPLHARFGRTGGGLVNVVTKSGGNDFAGSMRFYLSRNDWGTIPPGSDASGVSNTLANRRYDIFLSGPVVKDRLWFALSTIQSPSTKHLYTIGQGEDQSTWSPYPYGAIATPGQPYDGTHYINPQDPANAASGNYYPGYKYDLGHVMQSDESSDFVQAKLTLAISTDHTFDFTYNESTATLTNRNPYGYSSVYVATIQSHSLSQTGKDKYWSYGYRGTFGAKTFVEARDTQVLSESVFPAPSLPFVILYYPNNGWYPYGFNISPRPDARNNQSGSLNVKQFVDFAGTHEMDFGYDFFESVRGTSQQFGPNNRFFVSPWATGDDSAQGLAVVNANNLGADPYGHRVAFAALNYSEAVANGDAGPTYGLAPTYRQYFGSDGTTKNRTSALYFNDSWVINPKWNMMIGLRQDTFKVTDTDASTLISRKGPLSPRLQIRFDPEGNSKHLFTLTGAKYVQDIPVGFTDAFIKKATSAFAMYGWNAQAPGTVGWTDYNGLTNVNNYDLAHPYRFSDTRYNSIRLDISNPYVLEFTAGYRRTYSDGSYMSINGIMKEWKNDFAIWQDADPSFYRTVPDPTGAGLPSQVAFATKYGNSDLLKRSYSGVELEWRNNLSSVWTWGGNYTWSRLRGNNQGGDNTGQAFRLNGTQGVLSFRDTLMNGGYAGGTQANAKIPESAFGPNGYLANDRTHKARVYWTATLPIGKGRISYSAIVKYDSSTPYSAAVNSSLTGYLPAASATVPRSGMQTTWLHYYDQLGAFRRNDISTVDMKIDYAFPVWGKVQIMGDFQVNNAFNTQTNWQTVNNFTGSTVGYTAPIRVANVQTFGTDGGLSNNYISGRNFAASIGLKF